MLKRVEMLWILCQILTISGVGRNGNTEPGVCLSAVDVMDRRRSGYRLRRAFVMEMKKAARRPWGWVFLAAFSLFFYVAEVPSVSPCLSQGLEDTGPRMVASFGEWGRFSLIILWILGGAYSLFVSLYMVASLREESLHWEPLWVTPWAGSVEVSGAKLLAIGIWTTMLAVLASMATFLKPETWKVWTPFGWEYLPLYMILLLVQSLTWAAVSFFLFHLSRSRLLAIFGTVVTATLIPMLFSLSTNLTRTISYRSLVFWNFVSPLEPLGLIPAVLGLQGVGLFGVMLISFASGTLVRGRSVEWRGIRTAKSWLILGFGLVLTLGASVGIAHGLGSWKAPFEAHECVPWPWWGRPYIWDARGKLVFHPGKYTVIKTQPHLLPLWAEGLARSREVFQLPQDDCALVALYPKGQEVPPELQGAVARFQPLLKRAAILGAEPRLVVMPYGFLEYDIEATRGLLFISQDEVSFSDVSWVASRLACELTNDLKMDFPKRVYLVLYLLAAINLEKGFLEELRRGKYPPELPGWDPGKDVVQSILEHWQRGEKLGHENYIHMLLQGTEK